MKKQNKIKTYTLNEIKDEFIGRRGTKRREKYEYDLQMDIIGGVIKEVRKKKKMTQEELGEKIGVQKAQISKLENGSPNVTIGTLKRVFVALDTRISFNVQM
ncbi:MAG: helix-turn-helix transcriptional regulator [Bacteroidetes bacterium]|nr:helix-turn-helix transcriptional regulator [Bacteroidota bacterium]